MTSGDRGFRNNNPGNIRKSTTVWQGESSLQSDPDFVIFIAPEYGIRAIVRIMQSYQREGMTSVRQIIARWAPPSENDTVAYVQAVASQMGINPDDQVNFVTGMSSLVKAIIMHENGSQPYSDETIGLGISLA